ncbi:MAG: HlyD family efflux transporter periplasmic adaptor subunit [Bacteroidota bacterium]
MSTTVNGKKRAPELNPIQIQEIFFEEDVPLKNVLNALPRSSYLFLIGLVLCMAVFGATIPIPREVRVPILIRSAAEESQLAYAEPIQVESWQVALGDSVSEGAPLLTLTGPQARDRIATWQVAKQAETRYRDEAMQVHEQTVRKLGQLVAEYSASLVSLSHDAARQDEVFLAEGKAIQERLALEQNALKRQEQLAERGAAAEVAVEAQQVRVAEVQWNLAQLQRNHELQVQVNTREQQRVKTLLITHQEELATLQEAHQLKVAELYDAVAQAEQALTQAYGTCQWSAHSITVFSPLAGRVTALSPDAYQIPAGQQVMKISQSGSALSAVGLAASGHLGELQLGMTAQLKMVSFPYLHYGTLPFRVTGLAQSPDADGVFQVRLEPADAHALHPRLLQGMEGEASILVHEQSFFGWIGYLLARQFNDTF